MDASHSTRTRLRPRRAARQAGAVLAALTLTLCAGPSRALGQNPFAPLPTQPTQAPVVTIPTTSTTNGGAGDLSTKEEVALFVAGGLLMAGIAFLIRRDARAHTPAGELAGDRPRGTVVPQAKRVERNRARAKAARAQRRRRR